MRPPLANSCQLAAADKELAFSGLYVVGHFLKSSSAAWKKLDSKEILNAADLSVSLTDW
jgi:hypothetical protein